MKILVIDDNKENLEEAKKQLAEHEVVTCNSEQEIYKEYFFEYNGGHKRLKKFDVVLCDLLLPAGCYTERDTAEKKTGQMHMSGIVLCLIMAKIGVKKIGLVTAQWHHRDPIGTLLEMLKKVDVDGADLVIHTCQQYVGEEKKYEKDWKGALEKLLK